MDFVFGHIIRESFFDNPSVAGWSNAKAGMPFQEPRTVLAGGSKFRSGCGPSTYQSGELELCSLGLWKYRWEHVSVNVRNLGKGERTSATDGNRAEVR